MQFDVRLVGLHHVHALVVVVHGHGEASLGLLLTNHVVVQDVVDLPRARKRLRLDRRGGRDGLLVDDLVTEVDAFIADVHARPGDELLDLPLGLAAEAAEELLTGITRGI